MVFLAKFWHSQEKEKGQALLIVVLVIVVTLTVGLSLASRSIVQLRNTTDEANSQAAFAAAEAGVEQAIKLGDTTGTGVISGINLNDKNNSQISTVDVTVIQNDDLLLNNDLPLFQDSGADLWLSPYSTDQTQLFKLPWGGVVPQTLKLYWGTSSDPCADPAIEVLVISGTSPDFRKNPTLSKWAFDQCGTNSSVAASKRRNNNFPDAPQKGTFEVNGINGDRTFNYEADITITSGLIARIIPLYHPGYVGVHGPSLPEQGKIITSTGTAGISGQQVVRKVTFFEGHEQLPIQFYYSVFTAK